MGTREYSKADCKRKANQEWEMAGLARQDRDTDAADRHTANARMWEAKWREAKV